VRGASPAGTNVHTPGALATLQALHVSAHSLLQHRPSTQKPLAQSAAHVHASPLAARPPSVRAHCFSPPPPPPPQLMIVAVTQTTISQRAFTPRTYGPVSKK
jgi:hypothetical protein